MFGGLPTVDDGARFQLEQRYTLSRPDPKGDRTFRYALTDRSLENIRTLVRDPAVEDTHQIDRNEFRVESSAPSLPYVGIPAGLEYLSVLGFLGGLATVGVALITRSPTLVRWCNWVFGFVCGLASIGRTQLKRFRHWCNSVLGVLDGLASIGVALINRSPKLVRWIRFLDRVLARNQGLIRFSLIGLILLLPALSLSGLASVYLGQSLANFHPDMSDAIMYWHQIKTFAAVGFSGGYYTVWRRAGGGLFHAFLCLGSLVHRVIRPDGQSDGLESVVADAVRRRRGHARAARRPVADETELPATGVGAAGASDVLAPPPGTCRARCRSRFTTRSPSWLAGIFYRLLVHEGAVPHRLLGRRARHDRRGSPRAAHLGTAPAAPGDDRRREAAHTVAPRRAGAGSARCSAYWRLLPACAVIAGDFSAAFIRGRPLSEPVGHSMSNSC